MFRTIFALPPPPLPAPLKKILPCAYASDDHDILKNYYVLYMIIDSTFDHDYDIMR